MEEFKGLSALCCHIVLFAICLRGLAGHRMPDSGHNFLDEDADQLEQQRQQQQQDMQTPDFVTLGQKYSVAIGSTIVLPCKINDSDPSSHYVLAWKRDIAVLTAGNVKVTRNPRIRLMPAQHHHQQQQHQQSSYRSTHGGLQMSSSSALHASAAAAASSSSSSSAAAASAQSPLHASSYNLEIQNVRANDAGEYACQIGTIVPKEIVHSLEVLVPPKINYLVPSTKLEVAKGASIKLECKASGNPAPTIIWSRKNNVMPNGEANITNNVLEMMHADRHTVGHYKCTADNRVGQPDQRDIFVNVLYSPEIDPERSFVHTGVGYETQLICIVHAEPAPQVIWYKGNTQLGVTEQYSQQSRGNRYALNVRNVTLADLGNYTCQASNQFGSARDTITLTGIPSVCEFVDSSRLGAFHDQYNISWTVQSFEPLLEYRLYHRRQPNNSNRIVNAKMLHQQQQQQHLHQNNNNNYLSGHQFQKLGGADGIGGEQQDVEPIWEDIVIIPQASIGYGGGGYHQSRYGGAHFGNSMSGGSFVGDSPAVSGSATSQAHHHPASGGGGGNGQTGHHRTSYLIQNLRPASNYEVRVQARNVHGWNKLSSTFHFSTPAFEVDDPTNAGADYRPLTQQSSSNASNSAVASNWAQTTSCTLLGLVLAAVAMIS